MPCMQSVILWPHLFFVSPPLYSLHAFSFPSFLSLWPLVRVFICLCLSLVAGMVCVVEWAGSYSRERGASERLIRDWFQRLHHHSLHKPHRAPSRAWYHTHRSQTLLVSLWQTLCHSLVLVACMWHTQTCSWHCVIFLLRWGPQWGPQLPSSHYRQGGLLYPSEPHWRCVNWYDFALINIFYINNRLNVYV